LEVPSMSRSLIGRIPYAGRCWVWTNTESIKESEDPESTRDFKTISGRVSDVRERVSESGFERADALRVRVFTWGSSTQSLGHVESRGLLSLFSNPCRKTRICPDQIWMLGLGGSWAGFWTVLGNVSSGATKEAKLVFKMALTLLWS